ncbi:MAG: thiolase family protein [Planctomycetes bacterium]|nr:thiolase family protein [Planctomycetota bacterium]
MGMLGGLLKDLPATALAEHVLKALLARTKIDPKIVQEVIAGCVGQSSDAPNIARVVALRCGIPKEVPAFTVARNCASGFQAIVSAAHNLIAGDADVQIVLGIESMSGAPYINRDIRFGKKLRSSELVDTLWEGLTDPVCNQLMGRTAENLAEEFGLSREAQDKFAVESHKRAFRATREGKFKDEIAPIEVPKKVAGRAVAPELVAQDEGPNIALNLQVLGLYPTIFKENGTVTPGNSCPISDGACALLLMSEERAKALGLTPIALLRSWAFAGLEPERMGLGPTCATPLALRKAGLTLADMSLIELNEAFAAQVLACEKVLGLDLAKTNVNGGAIALGHPVGMTGARMSLTIAREMARRKAPFGLTTLCVGGGQGGALVWECAGGR